jgi:hypothetical protein
MAAVSTAAWSVKVFVGVAGRRSIAINSMVFASQAPSGWNL